MRRPAYLSRATLCIEYNSCSVVGSSMRIATCSKSAAICWLTRTGHRTGSSRIKFHTSAAGHWGRKTHTSACVCPHRDTHTKLDPDLDLILSLPAVISLLVNFILYVNRRVIIRMMHCKSGAYRVRTWSSFYIFYGIARGTNSLYVYTCACLYVWTNRTDNWIDR